MNADLHMAEDLCSNGKGNLFVIFGEPDIVVASEEWIVDSNGRKIAPYELFKIISGFNSLAEIQKLGGSDLQIYAEFSCDREVWNYLADEAGRYIGSSKHCGGTGAEYNGGVSPISWVSRGSLAELETFIIISEELGILSPENSQNLLKECEEISKMLNALQKKLK